MRLISFLIWTTIAWTCPIYFVGALVVFLLTVPFDRNRRVLHLYSSFWAASYVYLNPVWSVRVLGRERLPRSGPAVIVANHASLIDIIVLFMVYRPFKWVSKDANFRVPFLGWNMRLNDYVPLVRGDGESVRRMLVHCRRHLARGVPVMLFPEGTRSRDGRLQAFKDGAFALALEAGVPVIPIAVHGTGDALPKHGLVLQHRMDAVVEVLEPISPANAGSVEALREAARSAIAKALAERSTEGIAVQPAA